MIKTFIFFTILELITFSNIHCQPASLFTLFMIKTITGNFFPLNLIHLL
ncbi:hypothetical protein Pvag_pPag30412 (plasmid) [Pantoea vagans C9-1]|nr:hypothetical protein Pvag_pPag30412 [Pantoea vagans C9-1]